MDKYHLLLRNGQTAWLYSIDGRVVTFHVPLLAEAIGLGLVASGAADDFEIVVAVLERV
jgi:hypothetical protein